MNPLRKLDLALLRRGWLIGFDVSAWRRPYLYRSARVRSTRLWSFSCGPLSITYSPFPKENP